MSKIIVALIAALALAPSGCSSPSTTATGCVASRPDAGTAGNECLVQWACDGDTQHYRIDCTLVTSGTNVGNYTCNCTTDTTTLGRTVVVNAFSCDFAGGALPVAGQCGWMLQM